MKRLVFWGTIAAGATAAYLMHRRGESAGAIAKSVLSNPLAAFATEIRQAV